VNNKRVFLGISCFLALGAGFILGWFLRPTPQPTVQSIRENPLHYTFINPLLLSDVSPQENDPQYATLTAKLKKYIQTNENTGNASDISVYFRDLNSGLWTGVNENDQYSPASMLKIVTLIAILLKAESNPALLTTQVRVPTNTPTFDTKQDFYPPTQPLLPGQVYNNNDLLSAMIKESDDNAAVWLDSEIGTSSLARIYDELQLPDSTGAAIDFMSPALFSRVFRVLYNSTLLSHSLSNQTLQLLSETNFTGGLVSGVPASTTVAHKFGERTFTTTTGTPLSHELHDCGIVYYPHDPYFICVMTKGQSFPALQKIISDISAIIWNEARTFDTQNSSGL